MELRHVIEHRRPVRHQFNLNMINQRVVIDILLLALTSAPTIDSQDFNLALTLCLDRPPASLLQPNRDDYDDEDDMPSTTDEVALVVPFLQKCWSLLRECRFRDFWQCWKQEQGEGAERECLLVILLPWT